jgi:hypothetical protein
MRIRAVARDPIPAHLQQLIDAENALRAASTIPVRPEQTIDVAPPAPPVAAAGRGA